MNRNPQNLFPGERVQQWPSPVYSELPLNLTCFRGSRGEFSGARARGGARGGQAGAEPSQARLGARPARHHCRAGPRTSSRAQSSPSGPRPTPAPRTAGPPRPMAGEQEADRRGPGRPGEPGRRASRAAERRIPGGRGGGRDAPSPRRRGQEEGPRRRPRAAHPAPLPAPPPPSPFITWRCPRPAASCAQAGNALTDTISEAPKMADVSSRP